MALSPSKGGARCRTLGVTAQALPLARQRRILMLPTALLRAIARSGEASGRSPQHGFTQRSLFRPERHSGHEPGNHVVREADFLMVFTVDEHPSVARLHHLIGQQRIDKVSGVELAQIFAFLTNTNEADR